MARALVRQPDYLLLDEPFASLDTPFRLHLRRELLRILRRLDLSVVLVTHDPQAADRAQATLHLNKGVLVESAHVGSLA